MDLMNLVSIGLFLFALMFLLAILYIPYMIVHKIARSTVKSTKKTIASIRR